MKKSFKNEIIKYSVLAIIVFLTPILTHAETQKGYVDASLGLTIRKDAGTTYAKVSTFTNKTQVTILSTKNTSDSSTGCPTKKWYQITNGSVTGYACTQYIIIIDDKPISSSEMAKMTDAQFDSYLKSQGFTGNYITKLKTLHKAHPNWIFKGVNAKYSWSNTLDQESVKGRSLYQVTSSGVTNGLQGYLDTGSAYYNYTTDKFVALDGSTWFQANKATISYFLDPRNFLTESGIFMFEDLTYSKSYQTSEVISKILYTDFYKDYIKYYVQAAEKYNVSPVYLAALSRQEVGLNQSTATSGKAGTYNNKNYNGYYNFYNIGASSGSNPVYNGLNYSITSGWNTPEKAIVEGAGWIVNGYISKGQHTRYYQKWNVSPTTTTGIWHQYMTDIHALVSPAATTATSYNSMGIINESFVFTIPIYSGMPESTSLPKTGNPNNYLKDMKIDSKTVNNFSGSTTSYDLGTVENNKTSINISTTTVNSKASVTGNGVINLAVGKNTINVTVKAQNGSTKKYTLTITRKESDKPATQEISITKILNNISVKNNNTNIYGFSIGTKSSSLYQKILKENANSKVKIIDSKTNKEKTNTTTSIATGDKVTITSNNETKTYQVVIYGDINGDGEINAKDLIPLRKHLIDKNLKGVFLEATKIVDKTTDNSKNLLKLRQYLFDKNKYKINQI